MKNEKPIKLINLTPHPIKYIAPKGEVVELRPLGNVVRIAEKTVRVNYDGLYVVEDLEIGEIDNLPKPCDGVMYIVSRPIAMLLANKGIGRDDIIVPHKFTRNEYGHIVGCTAFARFVHQPTIWQRIKKRIMGK